MHTFWLKAKQLQCVPDLMIYSPIWSNNIDPELAKHKYTAKWQACGITHFSQIFSEAPYSCFLSCSHNMAYLTPCSSIIYN